MAGKQCNATAIEPISHEAIKKNSVIALYAIEPEDNNGLPFFLGKVLRVFNKNEKDDDDDKDDEQSERLPNTVWKFMSTSNPKLISNLQENTYFITSMEREKRGSKCCLHTNADY